MSAILGVFARDAAPPDDALVHHLMSRMRARGSDPPIVWRGAGATLAVARHPWESGAEFSGAVAVLREGDVVVAADASLYYRADLERRLAAAGESAAGPTPSHYILAAYRAWGDRCVRHLEGDYAFVLWDAARQRAFAARDFAGTRPLFYAEVSGGATLVVTSTVSALRAHPAGPDAWNIHFLAAAAANLSLPARETAYTALDALPAGFTLGRARCGATAVRRHWEPPAIDSGGAPSFAEDAAELRERLQAAVAERLARHTTVVFMSGGRDSPAVFAGGRQVLRGRPANGQQLVPISVSYPAGDVGREDELITAIAAFWGVPVHWLSIADIPFFDRADEYAVQRDEPWALPYYAFNRALARARRAAGGADAHVALDGWGGDQLFQTSAIHLADLFRAGRWIALAREWRALKVRDFRYFVRMAITPALPAGVRWAAALLRGGRPLPLWSDGWMPGWLRASLVPALRERQRSHTRPGRNGSFANDELRTFLTSPTVARARGWLSSLALAEQVEVRSPLYDARVIELAARRPASERRAGRDTKLLLRAALRGLLPESVLAPRAQRTGVTNHYLRNSMRALYPPLLDGALASTVVLAELGIVEPQAWRRAAEWCLADCWNPDAAMALCATLHTELWLRARLHERAATMATSRPSFRASGPGSPFTMEVQRV